MPITIGSNIASLNAQRRLSENTQGLERSYERLSSGMRINRASDDAAGLMIADTLRVDSRIKTQSIRNINDGISALTIASDAAQNLSGVVTRLRELTTQAVTGTLGAKQREALDAEAQALRLEFNRIVDVTKFNGVKVIDDQTGRIHLQVGGSDRNGMITIDSLNLGVGARNNGSYASGQLAQAQFATSIGDYNNDGFMDIAGLVGASFVLELGNGDGTFKSVQTIATGISIDNYAYDPIDFNNDGTLDLIVSDRVLLGNGDGTFKFTATSIINGPNNILGDFNGDGLIDYANLTSLYYGTGEGTFQYGRSMNYGSTHFDAYAFNTLDVDGDGHTDIISTVNAATEMRILFGNGDGTFRVGATTNNLAGNPLTFVESADMDNDGIRDLIGRDGDGINRVYRLDASGSLSLMDAFDEFSGSNSRMRVFDMNNDGNQDIVFDDSTNIITAFGNGNGTFSFVTNNQPYVSAGARIADFNGDLVYDVIGTNNGGGGTTRLFIGEGGTGSKMNSFSIENRRDAIYALNSFEKMQQNLSSAIGIFGAMQQRLKVAASALSNNKINVQDAESRIRDVDVAQESANLVRNQILQNVSASVLKQSNLSYEIVLSLLN